MNYPKTDEEADALRAYIPTETLTVIAKIRDEEIAQADKRSRQYDETAASIRVIKERMRLDRIALKKLEAKSREYFSARLFPRLDAAKAAAWDMAYERRAASIASGEPLRIETAAQVTVRQKVAQAAEVYVP